MSSRENLLRFINFVLERRQVFLNRKAGMKKPWTQDKILQTYKFTNVYREDDAVTRWIDDNIRLRFPDHPNLWFMLCAARQINWPDTLEELMKDPFAWPYNTTWKWQNMAKVMLARKARGEQVYTGAYMLTCQPPELVRDGEKANFTAEVVLGRVWAARVLVESKMLLHNTLAGAHAALQPYHGWGDFLIAQVVADLKYTRYLANAPDWHTWAVLGPGSTKGLNILYNHPLAQRWKPEEALVALNSLRAALQEALYQRGIAKPEELCAQDTQNCLCEFSKYYRTLKGTGKPRSLYPGV